MAVLVETLNRFSWQMRRRIIIGILVWGAALVTYLAVVGDASIRDTIAFNVIWLMGAVIGSYVFGASWDDQNARKTAIASQAVDNAAGQTDGTVTTTVSQ